MKYTITTTEVDKLPENWAMVSGWPGNGVYRVTTDAEKNHLYVVDDYGVNLCYNLSKQLQPVEENSGTVSEALLLKAIVAASHGRVA